MIRRLIRHKEAKQAKGDFVLYWMQQAQRTRYNPALDYAITQSQQMGISLVLCFVLNPDIPDANRRHYRFLIEGLAEIAADLKQKHIPFYLLAGDPVELIPVLAASACLLVMDHGYLRWQKAWRDRIFAASELNDTQIVEIDTEAIIPVHLLSDKEEYSAATLRRKLVKQLADWLSYSSSSFTVLPPPSFSIQNLPHYAYELEDIDRLWNWTLSELKLPDRPNEVNSFIGGYSRAKDYLNEFMNSKLCSYSQYRNHPDKDFQSNLSPYLHFGQISSLQIIHEILDKRDIPQALLPNLIAERKQLDGIALNVADFAEELIVRRELSMNFCHYNQNYDNPSCLPDWARKSLNNHLSDPRKSQYSLDRLEQGETNDPYWNAAQAEMMLSGKMHNYMRMYWGKRMLAWCPSVDEATAILLYLNNKYELDGRDANAFAGVAWCFGKHDRPWAERPIYGKIRYMNDTGLERKFNMDAYLKKISML